MGPLSVREYAASLRPRYRLASRRDKSRLLDEFCRVTKRDRKVAIRLLRHPPKRARRRTGRLQEYLRTLRPALEQVWEASDYLCSKRLAPFLPELIETLERHDAVTRSAERRTALLHISPATIDRLLRPVRPAVPPPRPRDDQPEPRGAAGASPAAHLRGVDQCAPRPRAGRFARALRGQRARLLPHLAARHRRRLRLDRAAGRVGQGPHARRHRRPPRAKPCRCPCSASILPTAANS